MMIGHFSGSVFNIFMAKIGNNLSKVLLLLTITSIAIGVSILSLLFIQGTTMICFVLMIWTFSK